PDDPPRFLEADGVGSHVPQVARWLHQLGLDRRALAPRTCHPAGSRPLVVSTRHDDGGRRAAMGEPRDHEAPRLGRGPQAVQPRAFRGGEGLLTRGTEASLRLAGMDANLPLTCLSSGGARQIGAACGGGIHACAPRFLLTYAKRSMAGSLCSSPPAYPTVQCRATLPKA